MFIKAIHREQNPDEPPDDRQQQQAEPGQRRKHQKVFLFRFKRYFFIDSIRTKYQSFSILTTQSSISDQLNELTTKHNESWSSVDSFLSKQVLFIFQKEDV